MNIDKLLESACFQREISQWELQRENRLLLEAKYVNFTGLVDVFELHVPYTQFRQLVDAMKLTSKKPGKKMMILNGDVMNMDLFSKFKDTSTDKSNPMDEFNRLVDVLKFASYVYDEIIYVTANHDKRVQKIISYAIHDKLQAEAIREFMYTINDLFKNNDLKVIVNDMYLIQIGDMIASHFENNKKVPYSTSKDIWEYLIAKLEKHWSIAFQSHTHKQSKDMINGKMIIQTGAMCGDLDYARSGKITYGHSSFGYGICTMKNGKVDINSCDYVVCGFGGKL